MLTKTLAALTVAAALLISVPTPAQASEGGGSAACDFQRGYPGLDLCGGQKWTIPVAQEDFMHIPATWTVRKGDTLWHIAVMAYSVGKPNAHAGQQYRKIMRLNHLHTTRLHVGQRLVLK